MGRVENKLSSLGESLPFPKKAVANYLGCKRSGSTLYVSGRVSPIRGEVGSDLTVFEAQVAAKEALLDILAIVKEEIGDWRFGQNHWNRKNARFCPIVLVFYGATASG